MARTPKQPQGRRSDGEGSIYAVPRTYRLADGAERTKTYWRAQIVWKDLADQQHREEVQRATKAEAKEWLARKRIEIASGKAVRADERKITIGEAIDTWLKTKEPRIRPSTKTVYASAGKHLESLRTQRIVTLTSDCVRACIERPNLSARMQVIMRMVLRGALRPYARVLQEELFPTGSAPKVRRKNLSVWSPEQAMTFLRHTSTTRLGLLWTMALLTGMRRGELLALKWIDIHEGWIEVSGSLDAQRQLVATKTAGSRRRIDLDADLSAKLRMLRGKDTEYVFSTASGKSLSPRNVLRDFRSAITLANKAEAREALAANREAVTIPTIRLHDLRHSHATLLLRANVHPKVVSERLGHASVRLTLDTYSHAVPTMQTAAATVVADMLSGPGPRAAVKSPKPRRIA